MPLTGPGSADICTMIVPFTRQYAVQEKLSIANSSPPNAELAVELDECIVILLVVSAAASAKLNDLLNEGVVPKSNAIVFVDPAAPAPETPE